ncbi:hypothetical protein QRD88_16405 [Bacillus safensis]|uniref:hypothetical protein n=1 Tax=Bacillus TaxID=1386 RepID=UPI000F7AC20B|nr:MULTISPECIES: hypothetical protein [Bacillus]TFV12529.1 hypothetical protein E4T85_01565 [Bacillus stratosphericus]MBR0604940.1 hypothetical protein [Bacillus safensis]MCM3366513.1 hypothetical protein [Bacillus safensis]MDJ0289054.1 hypothetical protein [Bacillus safensis]NMW00368.1 hypothetical protein [Bacillus safensis]
MKNEIDYRAKSVELERELVSLKKRMLQYIAVMKEINSEALSRDKIDVFNGIEKDQLLSKLRRVEKQLEVTERKLSALQNSTLGKLTLKYWNLRKRLRRGV